MIQSVSFDDVLVRATTTGRVAGRSATVAPGATLGSVSVEQLLAMMREDHSAIPRLDINGLQAAIRLHQQEMPHGDDTYI